MVEDRIHSVVGSKEKEINLLNSRLQNTIQHNVELEKEIDKFNKERLISEKSIKEVISDRDNYRKTMSEM